MATIRLFSDTDAAFQVQEALVGRDFLLKEAKERITSKTVFLSHSTKDDHLVPGVIAFFKTFNVGVYTDDFDKRLPNPPNTATAMILKSEIQSIPRLVVLATPNTHTSRWIPWELGLADGLRGIPPNAILPSTPEGQEPNWLKSEYFSLYPKILKIDEVWRVTDPRGTVSWPLRDWLHASVK